MGAPNSQLLVAVEGTRALVQVRGRACFTCSNDFKKLVYDLHGRGFRQFSLDLGQCTIMDSTFLGILARFAQLLAEEGCGPEHLALWNPSARIVELLDNLGVAHLFKVEQAHAPVTAVCEAVPAGPEDKLESTKIALEAHQTLMGLNPANVPKFKDVAAFMAEDLKRLGGTP
jgi:anti-anti-sigma regulatory factor